MRHVQFTITDGRTMDLDVTPRFEEIVREQYSMDSFEPVTDAHIKRFFIESLVSAKVGE